MNRTWNFDDLLRQLEKIKRMGSIEALRSSDREDLVL